jgi:hypothetical protein
MVLRIVFSIEGCLMADVWTLLLLLGWISTVKLLMVELELDASKTGSFLQGLKDAFLLSPSRRWERITEHLTDAPRQRDDLMSIPNTLHCLSSKAPSRFCSSLPSS